MSIELHASPNTGSRGTTYARYIKGFDAMRAEENPATELEGITVIDDLTVQIELTQPFRDFAAILSLPHRFLMAELRTTDRRRRMRRLVRRSRRDRPLHDRDRAYLGRTVGAGLVRARAQSQLARRCPDSAKGRAEVLFGPQTALIAYENDEYDVSEKYGPLEALSCWSRAAQRPMRCGRTSTR